ncbi:MAG: cell division protein ZapA [Eubacteriales bacterium]
MEEKARATVEIFGEEYIMKGDTTPEYMKMLANYIDKKMKHIASRQPQLSVTKIAVLAALNIGDELSKLQEDYDTLVKMRGSEKKEEKKNEKKQA